MDNPRRFFISDLHIGHKLLLWPNRPFRTLAEMREVIISNWNLRVKPQDIVYILGDISVGTEDKKPETVADFLSSVKGHKRWILGNHDHYRPELQKYVEQIDGAFVLGNQRWILTHIPVHPQCLAKRFYANIHGHTHTNDIDDPRYFNVSVEKINYTPISMDEIKSILSKRQEMSSWS